MPCYHPLKAFKSAQGVRILSSDATLFNLRLPCGQCIGCRLERSRQWALRCVHEASLHEHNSFLTLTYDDEHLPKDGSLNYRHFQLFMKRLRKAFPDSDIRFYMCGEYGETLGRPHYHCILFNHTFTDLKLFYKSSLGHSLFTSEKLDSLWGLGSCKIGAVTFESAAYVARYVMKKITGSQADDFYRKVDIDSGEIFWIVPEFNRMSLKPAIGADWFKKYSSDVFPHDRVVHDGTPMKPPRYYDKLHERVNPDSMSKIKVKRIVDASKFLYDNTPQRLITREKVKEASIKSLKRSFV